MTPDDVRAAAEQLVHFHDRFAPLFGKAQAQDHAYDFIKGPRSAPSAGGRGSRSPCWSATATSRACRSSSGPPPGRTTM